MGQDKSMLIYQKKPEVFRLYDMLEKHCTQVFISCNNKQAAAIRAEYNTLTDLPELSQCGPMGGLLTAYNCLPGNNFIFIGCDYPYLHPEELERFITFISTENSPAAFYHINKNLYEPLLAYYPAHAGNRLTEMHNSNQLSLQHFLQENQARKYLPIDENCMTGADTNTDYLKAKMYFASSDSAETEKTNGPD